jgi:asparagine synthetase B (glutamine-hydrolysing)
MPKHPKPNAFLKTIRAALSQHCPRKTTAVLFTGGLDSTVLALLSKDLDPLLVFAAVDDPRCSNYNQRSIVTCRKIARVLGLRFMVVPVQKENYLKQFFPLSRILRRLIDDPDLPAVMHLLKQLHKKRINTVISGMGADEIFGSSAQRLRKFLATEAQPIQLSHQAIAKNFRMRFLCPFLSPAVTRLALATPWPERKNKQPLAEILAQHPLVAQLLEGRTAAHSFVPDHFIHALRRLDQANDVPATKTASAE